MFICYQGDSLTHPILIIPSFFWHEDYREPRNEVGALSLAELLMEFETETLPIEHNALPH